MNIDEAKAKLTAAGLSIVTEKRLPNETGTQLRLDNESVVNFFDKGTLSVQGKNREAVDAALGAKVGAIVPASPGGVGKQNQQTKVFVVYGHDQRSRDQLEAMLRRWRLEPLILDQLATEGQTVIEKLESAMAEASFGVVLATPDDEGHRAGRPDEMALRARQNVVLEMGMLLARLGRKHVAILLKTQEKMERPSDIQGRIYIPFKDDIAKEAGVSLAKAMDSCGYKIDVARLWPPKPWLQATRRLLGLSHNVRTTLSPRLTAIPVVYTVDGCAFSGMSRNGVETSRIAGSTLSMCHVSLKDLRSPSRTIGFPIESIGSSPWGSSVTFACPSFTRKQRRLFV